MAHQQIGISSYSYVHACKAGMTPLALVQKAVLQQVSVVQMADNIHLEDCSEAELLAAKTYAEEHAIILETGFRGLLPEKLDQYLAISRMLDAHLMRMVIDAGDFQPSLEEIHLILEEFFPKLKRDNVVLGLETHDRFTAEEFAAVVKRMNTPYIGIILDPANCLSNEEPPLMTAAATAPYVNCFHAKDYIIRRRRTGMGLEIVGEVAGKGRLDIPRILRILDQKSPYPYNIILEFWADYEEPMEEILKKEEMLVTESINYLRSIV